MKSDSRRKEPQGTGSLARRMLEFLGIIKAYGQSVGAQEEEDARVNFPSDCNDWKPIEAALLEAEYHKAQAITQIRRHQIV